MPKKHAGKKTLTMNGIKIVVWKGLDGLMRLEIAAGKGRPILLGLSHPWEGLTDDGKDRIMFTDNEYIIEDLTGTSSADHRLSPQHLRKAGQDPVYREWYRASRQEDTSLEECANAVEDSRRSEGRDPRTGVLLKAPTSCL